LAKLPIFDEHNNNELASLFGVKIDSFEKAVKNEIELSEEFKKEIKGKQVKHLGLLSDLINQFETDMEELMDPSQVKVRENEQKAEKEARRAIFTEKVNLVYGSLQKSKLFCDFYYPEKYA
jgi:hypothetical protein